MLRQALRGQKLDGLKFRRQQPFGAFVVDFCCVSHLLVLEIDGGIHEEQIEYDAERTTIIEAYGFKVLRFSNSQVLTHLPSILEKIKATAATRHPLSRAPGEGSHAPLHRASSPTCGGASEHRIATRLPSPAHRERGRG